MEYLIKRSKRKTVSLEITADLHPLVRAPLSMSVADIETFVQKHTAWIEKHIARKRSFLHAYPEPRPDELRALREQAELTLLPLVEKYSKLMGLQVARVRITAAKTCFGSCSSKGNICFSCRLMQYPAAAFDYVVVHELAHLRYMNHSADFYAEIEKVLPDWQQRKALLKG